MVEDGGQMTDGSRTTVSVLVPVKDEVDALPQLVEEIAASLDGTDAPDGAGAVEWELLLIDDGRTDGSWSEIARLSPCSPG